MNDNIKLNHEPSKLYIPNPVLDLFNIMTGYKYESTGKPMEDKTLETTLEARKSTYGEFIGQATITQDLKSIMHKTGNWSELSNDKKEALEMIIHKIARILNGDANHLDSWHDISGYSKLVENNIKDKS